MVIIASALAGLSGLLLGTAALRWWATRAIEDESIDDVVTDRLTLLQAGHQPPPGLSPLSPSERFLAAEATRGMQELQAFLTDAA